MTMKISSPGTEDGDSTCSAEGRNFHQLHRGGGEAFATKRICQELKVEREKEIVVCGATGCYVLKSTQRRDRCSGGVRRTYPNKHLPHPAAKVTIQDSPPEDFPFHPHTRATFCPLSHPNSFLINSFPYMTFQRKSR